MDETSPVAPESASSTGNRERWKEIFLSFFRLGLISFGGPVAHLGYFHKEFVEKKKWLDEARYADVMALCQFLPGPASSQVGFSIGLMRGGWVGGLLAWLGFTLPSAILMILAAYGVSSWGYDDTGWVVGLKIAAAVVVAHAIWGMGTKLCPDRGRLTLMVLAAAVALMVNGVGGQVLAILIGALAGWWLYREQSGSIPAAGLDVPVSRRSSFICLMVFFVLLFGLPFLAAVVPVSVVALLSHFYSAGALVFGGGHVVLPLLQAGVVETDWVRPDAFMAGYGLAQAVPGPLFTFAAYLGASLEPSMKIGPAWIGGLFCLLAIYLPSVLLVVGVLPYWDSWRRKVVVRAGMLGVHAAVVGLLVAAFYQPVWITAVRQPAHFVWFIIFFAALQWWRVPAWGLVVVAAIIGKVFL